MKAPQLTGTGEGTRTISLQALAQKKGVTILGKMENAAGKSVFLQPNAPLHIKFADDFSKKGKGMIDEFILRNQLSVSASELDEADVPDTNASCATLLTSLNLEENHIHSIIWSTGFNGNFSYLNLPVLDRNGNPKHQNGISAVEGLYFLGFPWLRTRKSSLICGIKDDAAFITEKVYNSCNKSAHS